MNVDKSINYIEFPCRDFDRTKAFFSEVFGWTFTDYGDNYQAFHNAGLEGGFYKADAESKTENGSALIVFFTENLEELQSLIIKSGGKVVKNIFSFPGGRRFHFIEPSGNEFAVWSNK